MGSILIAYNQRTKWRTWRKSDEPVVSDLFVWLTIITCVFIIWNGKKLTPQWPSVGCTGAGRTIIFSIILCSVYVCRVFIIYFRGMFEKLYVFIRSFFIFILDYGSLLWTWGIVFYNKYNFRDEFGLRIFKTT